MADSFLRNVGSEYFLDVKILPLSEVNLGASQMGVTNGEKMNLQEEDPTNTIFERIEPASP